jgi:hypothetical protein
MHTHKSHCSRSVICSSSVHFICVAHVQTALTKEKKHTAPVFAKAINYTKTTAAALLLIHEYRVCVSYWSKHIMNTSCICCCYRNYYVLLLCAKRLLTITVTYVSNCFLYMLCFFNVRPKTAQCGSQQQQLQQ